MTTSRAMKPCLALALLLSSVGCNEDTVDVPDELVGDAYCALIIGTYGHYEDGGRLLIADYARETVAVGCVCASEEEIRSGARDQDLEDAALAECQRWAATQDFAWDECLEDYEADEWLFVIVRAEGEDAGYKPPGFSCYGGG